MRIITKLLAAGIAAAACLPADADWQYTKWDMTRDEVIAASQGQVRTVEGSSKERVSDQDLKAQGTYSENLIEFRSQFYFNSAGKLKIVRLTPLDLSNCTLLRLYVEGRYGTPNAAAAPLKSNILRNVSEVWLDQAGNDVVRYTELAIAIENRGFQICFVTYSPLNSIDKDFKMHFD